MQQLLIAFGLSTEHLVSIAPDLQVEDETANAFQALGRRAAERGLDLRCEGRQKKLRLRRT